MNDHIEDFIKAYETRQRIKRSGHYPKGWQSNDRDWLRTSLAKFPAPTEKPVRDIARDQFISPTKWDAPTENITEYVTKKACKKHPNELVPCDVCPTENREDLNICSEHIKRAKDCPRCYPFSENSDSYSKRDHRHCWEELDPPCGMVSKTHRCCLCEEPVPENSEEHYVQSKEFADTIESYLGPSESVEKFEGMLNDAQVSDHNRRRFVEALIRYSQKEKTKLVQDLLDHYWDSLEDERPILELHIRAIAKAHGLDI